MLIRLLQATAVLLYGLLLSSTAHSNSPNISELQTDSVDLNHANRNEIMRQTHDFDTHIPQGSSILSATLGVRNGLEYKFAKFKRKNSDKIESVLIRPNGRVSYDSILPAMPNNKIGLDLAISLENAKAKDTLDVVLSFDSKLPRPEPKKSIVGSRVLDDEPSYFLNDLEVSIEKIQKFDEEYLQELERYERSSLEKTEEIRNTALAALGVLENRQIQQAYGGSTSRISLSKEEINKIVDNTNLVSISLFKEATTDINNAVQWSGINDHARFGTHQGANIGIWQTEPACPPNNWGPVGNIITTYFGPASANNNIIHAEDMARIMRVVSPQAFIQCAQGSVLPTLAQANAATPQIQVISRSASFVTGSSNYQAVDQAADTNIQNTLVPHVNSASNITSASPFTVIRAGSRGLNVLTIGDVNIDTTPLASIWPNSKWANSNIQNEKPEISAPGRGTFLPLLGRTTGGTSAATAHTGGFIANLLDNDTAIIRRPMGVKALVMSGSTNIVTGGIGRVGVGGINYRDTSQFYETRNFRFNGTLPTILTSVYLDSSKPNVRAVLTWLNDGVFTLNNGTLSVDWDLEVLDSNSNVIATSASHVDPFESIDFTITSSGVYSFRLT